MFFGDSHSRQFKPGNAWGNLSFTSFSGASIKGLRNESSKTLHAVTIRNLAATSPEKSIYLMFGQVDLDFSIYREALKPDFSLDEFMRERVRIYVEFVQILAGFEHVSHISILAPQPSPIPDDLFSKVTAEHAELTVEQMLSLEGRIDTSAKQRIARTIAFADLLEVSFRNVPKTSVSRIDSQMVDEQGGLRREFLPRKATDHHSNAQKTLPLWLDHLAQYIPWFAYQRKQGLLKSRKALVGVKAGGWCWFQDRRLVSIGDRLAIATVRGGGGLDVGSGSICVTFFNPTNGKTDDVVLMSGLRINDHNTPSLLKTGERELIAAFSEHNGHEIFVRRIRVSKGKPYVASAYSIKLDARITYCNLIKMGEAIYLFHRGEGWNPNFLMSSDAGKSFQCGGRILRWSADGSKAKSTGKKGGGRPYVQYRQGPGNKVHIICTEDHPAAYATSLYHGVFMRGKVYRSDGKRLSGFWQKSVSPEELTLIFEGDKDKTAFPCDTQLGSNGTIATVFSVKVDGGPACGHEKGGEGGRDQRYFYARWDGANWKTTQIAFAGTCFTDEFREFTGLACINPRDLNDIVISCNVDPESGVPLGTYKLFRKSLDKAEGWKQLTEPPEGQLDIRPVFVWHQKTPLIAWMRGTYRDFFKYDTAIMLCPGTASNDLF